MPLIAGVNRETSGALLHLSVQRYGKEREIDRLFNALGAIKGLGLLQVS